uniref:Uncharacterized protein n=1 Tax=Steinernema glaseri TaxID=37863 RepID=A0A1I7YPM4_9BILA
MFLTPSPKISSARKQKHGRHSVLHLSENRTSIKKTGEVMDVSPVDISPNAHAGFCTAGQGLDTNPNQLGRMEILLGMIAMHNGVQWSFCDFLCHSCLPVPCADLCVLLDWDKEGEGRSPITFTITITIRFTITSLRAPVSSAFAESLPAARYSVTKV